MGDGVVEQVDADQVAAGVLAGLLDGIGDFVGLAEAEADAALLVAARRRGR